MTQRFSSGLLVNDLLFLRNNHRAGYAFYQAENLNDEGVLRLRRCDEKLWSYLRKNPLSENVMRYIREAGFEGIFQCETWRVDNALVSALVERWRPETHTFHMPFEEVTITLQDVAVLFGLRVEGTVLCGIERKWSDDEIITTFLELTGIEITSEEISSQRINMTFVMDAIEETQLLDNATELQCTQRARAIILLIIGGTLFCESANNFVHVKFLNHINDLNQCGQISWGSAVLAVLYRNLCKAVDPKSIEIGGAMLLLQFWAWERFPSIAPKTFYDIDWSKTLWFTMAWSAIASSQPLARCGRLPVNVSFFIRVSIFVVPV
ncbi:serine/threonine-protein phosphatase 7 long form homolog [Bidens hawaiensis]|uniref:serine/threonine-protein phosphatase 7 long form homolog n=1 Tax=Bidens hawaiensis TaxID=980011 RepID=UPI00404AC575